VRQMRPPTRWSATPPTVRRPAPGLGEHTAEVLGEIGLSDSAVRAITTPQPRKAVA
jgi:crotonobetainyl-CoA:carnitine CoA-transferase CaiB-like acyl-CoA transferase